MEERVTKLESEMIEGRKDIVDIKTRLAVAESNIKDMKEDLFTIKNNTNWILRLIIGTIVLALLAIVLQGGS